jgi:hypothetical protein
LCPGLIVALSLCEVTYPEILLTVAWTNVVGFKAVKFVKTICFETLCLSSFPFVLILQSYLSLGHNFNVLCVLTKTSTYLFSFKGISKAAIHSQTPNSQRAVVSHNSGFVSGNNSRCWDGCNKSNSLCSPSTVLWNIYVGRILKLNSDVLWQVQTFDAARIFFVTSAIEDRNIRSIYRSRFQWYICFLSSITDIHNFSSHFSLCVCVCVCVCVCE